MSNSIFVDPVKRLAFAALVLGSLIISFSPILVKVSEIGPISTGFWRIALALLPLAIWARSETDRDTGSERPKTVFDYFLVSLPGFFMACNLVCWHLAISLISVANASLLANTAPIFVVIGGWLVFRTAVSRRFLFAVAIAIVGIIIFEGGPAELGGNPMGEILAVGAGACYAGYMLGMGKLRGRFSTATLIFASTVSATVCILPVALIFETGLFDMTVYGLLLVLVLAWFCHSMGQGVIIFAMGALPVAFSSLTLLLQPVFATIFAWLLLSEQIGWMQAFGGVVVLGGILIAQRG